MANGKYNCMDCIFSRYEKTESSWVCVCIRYPKKLITIVNQGGKVEDSRCNWKYPEVDNMEYFCCGEWKINTSKIRTCKYCRYYYSDEKECRLYSPGYNKSYIIFDGFEINFPPTFSHNFCGEWKRRDNTLRSCKNCIHRDTDGDYDADEGTVTFYSCRRFPPKYSISKTFYPKEKYETKSHNSIGVETVYGSNDPNCWCGEWKSDEEF